MAKGPIRRWPHPGQQEGMTVADAIVWGCVLGGHAADVDDLLTDDGDWCGRTFITPHEIREADAWARVDGYFGLTAAEREDLTERPWCIVGGSALGFAYMQRFASKAERDRVFGEIETAWEV